VSLIGKALRARNSVPVPMGSPSVVPGVSVLGSPGMSEQALLKAYKKQGTVRSNVGLLAASVAGPQWQMFRSVIDGRRRYSTHDQGSDQREEVIKHAALSALNSPANITYDGITVAAFTRFQLFEISGIWMEVLGRSTWVVDRFPGTNVPLGLWPVRPDRMRPVPDAVNWLKGWIYTSPDGRERVPLEPTDVIWNRYPDPEDVYGSCGPVESVLTEVEAVRFATEWNRNYFVNSAEPGGVIEVDHSLDDDEWNDLEERWREGHKGTARAHRVAVLENGQRWVANQHSIKDMDFVQLVSSGGDRIREALAMHKVMTGVTDDVNRANAQTGEEVFASWSVAPRLNRWRDVLNGQFLPLFGGTAKGVEFDFMYPTPANREQDALELTTKSAAAAALIGAGMEPEDVLVAVGLPAMRVAQRATQQPALPPGWVALPPAMPAGPAEPSDAAQAALRVLRAGAGWDSRAWAGLDEASRRNAAWNALAGASR
jgi:Phage portal protein